MDIDTHPRTLRRNIWNVLLAASDQEIREGLDFYSGAYGLCRFFSRLHPDVTPSQVAGIYSALSPMNTWDTNVSNILDVLRDWSAASVNTTDINLHKALQIRLGSDPLSVLAGRKVTSFYRAISNPNDNTPIPVDRHLINLALGVFPDKSTQSRLASNNDTYSRVESAYHDLGKREGIGNRLASIAWFVQRRIARTGQQPLPHPDSPYCCGHPMYLHGVRKQRGRRFRCSICNRIMMPEYCPIKVDLSKIVLDYPIEYPLSILGSAPIVYLPRNHPHRNSAGFQYLARHIVMLATGKLLRRDEHVHHTDGVKLNCRRDNLEVWLAERHGRYHARHQLLYMLRDQSSGQFIKSSVPPFSKQISGQVYQEEDDLSDIPF